MITGVRPLESIYHFKDSHFGYKANNLSYLLSNKLGVDYVLPGFCVTFDMRDKYLPQLENYKTEMEKSYYDLVAVNTCKMVIVRSSADREDGTEALFPGVLKSIASITNFSDLYQAVKQCVESAWKINVQKYTQAHGISSRFDFFTVLIQVELQTEYAGVAFTHLPYIYDEDIMITQLTRGNNHALVNGLGSSNMYSLFNDRKRLAYRCLKQEFPLENTVEKEILEKLYANLSELKGFFPYQLDIEWGYEAGKIYIYQARHLKSLSSCRIKNRYISAFKDHADQGLKFQAMHFFTNCNLFQRKTFLFPKKTAMHKIEKTLLEQAEDVPLTIRFSNQRNIGLPRIFAVSPQDAVVQMRKMKQDGWSVIAYSSLKVRESFELYFDENKTILEHVPGMWESDSKLVSDVTLLTEKNISFWLASEARTAKYEDYTGVHMHRVEPISFTSAYKYIADFFPIIKNLRSLFEQDLPLNLHFVSDGESLFFLNCRLSEQIDWLEHNRCSLYEVHSISDCAKWDGKSSILFTPQLCRGEESNLLEFIPFLKQVNVPIFVDFGVLSHPAIMLREFGINVLPRLIHHNYYKITNAFAKE